MELPDADDARVDVSSVQIDALPTSLEASDGTVQGPPVSPFQASVRRFRRDQRALIALLVLLLIGLATVVFPPIYQHTGQPLREQYAPGFVVTFPPEQYRSSTFQDPTLVRQYPSALHWLGTDDGGQDILARLLKGWQVTLLVVLVVELQNVALGTCIGILAGYYGGLLDMLLARYTDVMFAFPGLLLAILVAGIFGPSFDDLSVLGIEFGPYGRVIPLCLVLGVIGWPMMARIARGKTLQLKAQPFVEAACSCGTSTLKILLRHILPNMGGLILVSTMLDVIGNIGIEGAFSYLGLGVQAPGSGLGLMTSEYAPYLQSFGYELIWPLLGVGVLVVCCTYVCDGLEAAFDPREQDYGY